MSVGGSHSLTALCLETTKMSDAVKKKKKKIKDANSESDLGQNSEPGEVQVWVDKVKKETTKRSSTVTERFILPACRALTNELPIAPFSAPYLCAVSFPGLTARRTASRETESRWGDLRVSLPFLSGYQRHPNTHRFHTEWVEILFHEKKNFSLCLFDSYSRHLGENDFIVNESSGVSFFSHFQLLVCLLIFFNGGKKMRLGSEKVGKHHFLWR